MSTRTATNQNMALANCEPMRELDSKHPTLLTSDDLHLFNEGTHTRLYNKLGAHLCEVAGAAGAYFAVWAPNASHVSVIGEFNGWLPGDKPLCRRDQSGIFEGFIPDVKRGTLYKFHVSSQDGSYRVDKPDPYGVFFEQQLRGASIVWDLGYEWRDSEWMSSRGLRHKQDVPMCVYEIHLGSWRRKVEDGNRALSYAELAEELPAYVKSMGFTHVEFMPVMEHPYYPSWGYQVTGYFAPTSRYGNPQEFMHLVDRLHQEGIGVILDWVPSHFATDEHGLGLFDGTHVYEHADKRQGRHPDWDSYIFNYGRKEVRSFLLSNALYWFDKFHIDGMRVDAVASMLQLNYSRKDGEWIPNEYGGTENLEAIDFLKEFNKEVYANYPDVQTIAEESSTYPMVSKPLYVGGLGFGYKWDMGWMNDTLKYMRRDPVYRKYEHTKLTFRQMYAHTENFMLPLSHDEVVHGKCSLLHQMSGDMWQQFAHLRLLYGYQYTQQGKKLLFMGGEIAQRNEWYHEVSLDWHLLDHPPHWGVQKWVSHLNDCYRREPALHEMDCRPEGFQWVDCNDADNSTLAYLRWADRPNEVILVACNFTPMPRIHHRVGVPYGGQWLEILNSDSMDYGGSGLGNMGAVQSEAVFCHGREHSVDLTLPPLGMVLLKYGINSSE